jgi:Uma2 family endonuclease
MTTSVRDLIPRASVGEFELHSGDQMSREEFHRIYEKMPDHVKAELVGGVVYVASPLRVRHGTSQPALTTALFLYEVNTLGVEVGDNTTVLLGVDGELQPDLYMRILPQFGGQSKTSPQDYVLGAPELVIEISHSTRSLDMNSKKHEYARNGVREYIVWTLSENALHWFDLAAGDELSPGPDGVMRVRTFPGLWIDTAALLAKDYKRFVATLQQGLTTPEHSEFVEHIARAKAQS